WQERRMESRGTKPYTLDCIPTGALQANCYLLTCTLTRQTLVVDPGAEAGQILSQLKALGTTGGSVVHTHGHFDHIAATEALLARLARPAPILAHPADAFLYTREARAVGATFGYAVPKTLATPDVALEDGAEVSVGVLRLRVLHTP